MQKPITRDAFIAKARAVHGDRFSYDKVDYVNSLTKVTITCPDHGDFSQVPSSHIAGHGCVLCHKQRMKGDTHPRWVGVEPVRQRIDPMLGPLITADWSTYQGTHKKMQFACTRHGVWSATPDNVERAGSRCPKCARSGFDPGLPATLYYIRVDGLYYKIGVTVGSVATRFAGRKGIEILEEHWFDDGAEALTLEQQFLAAALKAGIPRLERKIMGRHKGDTECFLEDIRGLPLA